MQVDSKGNEYYMIDDWLRVTIVKEGWNDEPSIRIQRCTDGKPNPGPEITMSSVSELIKTLALAYGKATVVESIPVRVGNGIAFKPKRKL